ncbi:glycosyltransferase family 9 protein [Acaryochloris marina]|uniref:glycosyltransferase family 9 protein n=1 Tax=Acaryochloris marina TaxID=155978 RepID=UPI0020170E7F|nr:hypothetical protein [Acaryochloris marina]
MTRILALLPGDVGRQLLFFPTLETLQHQYSQVEIDVIVEPRAKQAYRLCRNVENVLTFQFENRNGAADWGNLIGKMRDRRYDAGITLSRDWTGVSKGSGMHGSKKNGSRTIDPVPEPKNYHAPTIAIANRASP